MKNLVKIKENKNFSRVNDSYIINTNEDDYRKAIERRKKLTGLMNMHDVVNKLQEQVKLLTEQLSKSND